MKPGFRCWAGLLLSWGAASCVLAGKDFPQRNATASQEALNSGVITIAGGRYRSAFGGSELTYLIDTRTGVCLVVADNVFGALGAAGLATLDCCRLQKVAPASARAFLAALSCTAAAESSPTQEGTAAPGAPTSGGWYTTP